MSCSREAGPDSRFCPGCGAPLPRDSALPTRIRSTPEEPQGDAVPEAPHGFLPGAVLAGRYRIVMPVGQGGMGEVYRAEDLKLGQAVALKFLPERVQAEPSRIARLLEEVRLARQVSHPNVARVWDVGEVEGRHFLSMEFVDGEDLASLLRRVGRLPEDRAVQVARQLCAGLAAAHEVGILHRDLKPSNVMIDGRGRVRITDFGLAVVAEKLEGLDARAGTPAYMAPEQLAGREVTQRSDLYALGLVLYELFTGQRAFDEGIAGRVDRDRTSTPKPPSSHVKGLDPAVEAAILRCLEADPQARPPSALAVAAALPGGDPLAAALAAGETPSPELVAAAGGVGGLSPGVAIACLGLILVGLVAVARLAERTTLLYRVPLDKPPAVLRDRAQTLLRDLGYRQEPVDTDEGFDYDRDYLAYLKEHLAEIPSPGLTGAVYYWYRQAPEEMGRRVLAWAVRSFSNPSPTTAGMAGVRLDTEGRLLELLAAPSAEAPAPTAPVDWTKPFEAAGLDPAEFRTVEPAPVPPVYADTRRAWEGTSRRWPGLSLRVEAGAFGGRPVYFRITGPWTRAPGPPQPWETVALALFVLAGMLARRNHRLGRTDPRSAGRLAAGYLVLAFVSEGLYLLPDLPARRVVVWGAFAILFLTTFLWIGYLAVEPFVRRHWPDVLTSWTRVLNGRFRDPVVGRDALLAILAGLLLALLSQGTALIKGTRGLLDVPEANSYPLAALLGGRPLLVQVLFAVPLAVVMVMLFLLVLVLLRVLLRRRWAAFLAAVPVLLVLFGSDFEGWTDVALSALFLGLLLAILVRWGLLAASLALAVDILAEDVPMTLHLGTWYGGGALAVTIVLLVLGAYGFFTALASRSLVPERLFEG